MIEKLILDLKSGKLSIVTERVATSTNNVANEIDRIAFSYGYVDFGKDNIIYGLEPKNKIIVWTEILDFEYDILEKVLAYLIEIYLSVDEEKIILNYSILKDALKRNNKFEYMVLTDFYDGILPAIGGFRKSILDKWCCYLDFASSDLISSYITGNYYILNRRAKFLNLLLEINNYSIEDLVNNKRKNNLKFIEKIIPKEYCTKISLFSTLIENTDNSTKRMIFKYKLENEIYRYISYLFYEERLQRFNEDKREEIIEKLLSQSYTMYNPDIKLDCGII
jgi:hypothetical protein